MRDARFPQAQHLYRQGRLPQAAGLLNEILRTNAGDAGATQLLGVVMFQGGKAAEGRRLVERAIALDPGNADAWNSLGLMQHLSGENPAAIESFESATAADAKHGEAWMNRGFVLQEMGRSEEAIRSLEEAIATGFENEQVHFFLGNAWASLGRQDQALASYDKAVKRNPQFADAWHNRGNTLLSLGQAAKAAESIERAIRLSPNDPLQKANYAAVLNRLGRVEEALTLLGDLIRKHPNLIEAQRVKADVFIEHNRSEEAIATLEGLLLRQPDMTGARVSLGQALQQSGAWRESIATSEASSSAASQMLSAVTLPVILDSADAVPEARAHLSSALDRVRASEATLVDPLKEVGMTTFYLAYHGIGERDLQQKVAETYRQICPALGFHASHTAWKAERIRLGVLSGFLHGHTIGKLYARLIAQLDRERFEIVFFQLGKTDQVSTQLAHSVDRHVLLGSSLSDSREQIAKQELDILLYPEVGMDPQTYYLAFSRLAPVQCVLWGHPMTTGSPCIDWFISSEHLEREGGDAEYSERLARLPSLTTYFARPPEAALLSRADLGLPDEATLYACPQTLFKFHPNYDRVLAEILSADNRSRLVLIEPKQRHWMDLLVQRWKTDYPVIADRAIFLPGMQLDRFLALAKLSDCVLDPIQFGGGNSTMEFFSVGAPVVTLPQSLLRNRISYAAYMQIGFTDLIAKDEADYSAMAHRLANDRDWQTEMRSQVLELSRPLFDNRAAVEELSGFLGGLRA